MKKRGWPGGRYDGRRIRGSDPLFNVIPKIMRTRLDSQVMFEEVIDMHVVDEYVHRKRLEGYTNLRSLHVFIAALVRVLSQRPKVNRFVCGKKIYARNYLRIAFAVKKEMNLEGEEAIIQTVFAPEDAMAEVVRKVNESINEEFMTEDGNKTEQTARLLRFLPDFLLSLLVFSARHLDNIGLLPRFINEASPFHSSIFITDIGSLGIKPVYHHLYEFGTCSVFMSVGRKEKHPYFINGILTEKKVIGMRFVTDERICDGYYYASAIKMFKYYLRHPELLEQPPEKVVIDRDC